mmetsp:Transcript_34355/g.24853  ORF Transcript_34355/g.24853 Transcript_34355/m.24853 type:complete len:141 (+) Transcript_34355:40-462(+)
MTAETVIVVLAFSFLVRRYSDGKPLIAPILAVIGFSFAFCMILLVPNDLYMTYSYDTDGELIINQEDALYPMVVTWTALSYTSQLLNYIVFPYVKSYIVSGAFTVPSRICASLKDNFKMYLFYIFGGIAFILLLYFTAQG